MEKRLDLLDRSEFVNNVVRLVNQLADNRRGCCFAIEGDWGIGKTYVMEEIKVKLAQGKTYESVSDRYFMFHYNCWQYDYYEEPAIAIISAMFSSVRKEKSVFNESVDSFVKSGYEVAWEKLKEIAGLCIENKIGINLISLAKEIKDTQEDNENKEHEFDSMFNFSQTIESVREKLQEVAGEKTIILFVDELDRCIPRYAIKVLERLHHIFYGLENVIVIMAIDRKQLEHSVEEMFGIKDDERYMDVDKYLKKFIDFSIVLDCGEMNDLFFQKYSYYFDRSVIPTAAREQNELRELFQNLFKGMDIRRQEKLIEKANIVHSIICDEKVDISVLAFEIFYEVLKLWKFGDMGYLVRINDTYDTNVEQKIGKERYEMLKSMEMKHTEKLPSNSPRLRQLDRFSVWGKILWYFSNVFNRRNMPYVSPAQEDKWMKKEVGIAGKYCELCELIK